MTKVIINGKDYPVSFGLNAIRLYCQNKGCDMPDFYKFVEEISKKAEKDDPAAFTLDDFEAVAILTLSAIQEGCRKEKQDCNLEMEDVFNVLTDDGVLSTVFSELGKSMVIPNEAKNFLAQPTKNRQQRRADKK